MWWWVSIAWGAVPDGVFPVLAHDEVPAQWVADGQPGMLACDALWKGQAVLCYRVRDGKRRRLVTTADLASWGVDAAELRREVTTRARAALAANPPALTPIEGTGKSYWLAASGDGWAAAGILAPEVVVALVGGSFLAVAPVDGAVMYWRPGDRDLDTIVAVGAKEMYERADWPVSPVVYQWTGQTWAPFVEAMPSEEPALP